MEVMEAKTLDSLENNIENRGKMPPLPPLPPQTT